MPAIHRRWTTADVRALIDESRYWPRYELIGGELIVTPSPGVPHQVAVAELVFIVKTYLDKQGIGLPLFSPADLELVPESITQPDVFVLDPHSVADDVEMPTWSDFKRLLLAVEVISPSSIRIDRVMKRDFYLDAGVPEYWILDVDARIIERWTQGRESPEVCRDSLVWLPENASVALTIDVPDLFETIRVKSGMPRRL
ncbi:MAG: Uma2 family endonuclease [Gemmatimonadota bacterium]|nr:Uma2 family endonuclease [Gemmatimonadota bacterium]